jgi:uncharacterized protein YjiK
VKVKQENMKIKPIIILLLFFLANLTACLQDSKTFVLFERAGYHFQYQLAAPGKVWKLPASLVEISGLSFLEKDRLACIEDENGIIYIFNTLTGEIEMKIAFGEAGDYEGIEIINEDAWVLKSNGTLYEMRDFLDKQVPFVKKYTTALSGKNNTEGLAYDPENNRLLIACKENPFPDSDKGNGFKSIYSFSPATGKMDQEPLLLIDLGTLVKYKGNKTFKPSGIAVQPVTGDLFILGAVGNLLMVLSGKGELLALVKLSHAGFPQPEGICFSPGGILYISNEGAGRQGTILKFEPER